MTDETRKIVERLRGVAEEMALLRSSAYEGDLPIIEEAGDVAEMAANKIERLSAEVKRLRGEPVGYRVRDRGGIWSHWTWDKPPLFATSDPRYTVHPIGPAVEVSDG